jgi:hypothetical protein
MSGYYDRYAKFRENGNIKPVPGIKIPKISSDKTAIYKQSLSRLDKISDTYYDNPYSGWLILLANPEFGGLEFNIPDMALLRIPFPFESAIDSYITAIENHKLLYG